VERPLVAVRAAISRASSRRPARGEEWCDAATKTHINDTPCYYYSYAIAQVFKYQLNDYIAKKILHQPPQSCNYANNPAVGDFFRKIMEKGKTEDWRKVLKEATGEELSHPRHGGVLRPAHEMRCRSRTRAGRSAGSEDKGPGSRPW